MLKKGSKVIRCMTIFAIIMAILLVLAMISNLIIFENRQEIYESNHLTIKYFNDLISDIC